ncbi:MAG TPA: alpha/beta hydrolase family protein, partial [Edaphobacter sp.]|nr:alpha/beta hydrolase family protein [Edaphobacter sp.]
WDEKRAQLQTALDVQKRNETVRRNLLTMLGAFPPRSPLNARTVRVAEKDGYRLENVLFCSRPEFWVTGNLYVPTTGKGPFPAVVSPCGHYPLARMLPQYQSAYISLVKSGFVVFAYDPIGQGERRQYWNPATDITDVGGPVFEHSMAGQDLFLLGETLTGYMVWDGMRAIDYLLSRPEVDLTKIGCAGHSGGGTITKFLAVADERIQCAAILEGGTENAWPARSIGLGDAEQNLFPAALYGVDNVDLEVAIAPRPLLVAIEHDSPGFQRAVGAIEMRYRQLSAEKKFSTVVSDDPHAWTPKLRLATADWFCKWFYDRPGPSEEFVYQTSAPSELYCTQDGSLRYSHTGKSIFDIIFEKQSHLPPPRPSPKTRTQFIERQRETRERLATLLRYRNQAHPLGVRHIVTVPREDYQIEKIEFLSEPGIYIPAWVFVPARKKEKLPTVLYFSEDGIQNDGMEFEGAEASGLQHGVLDRLVREGYLIVAADVRGIGQTCPPSNSRLSSEPFGQLFNFDTAMTYAAWSMDRSLLGMRVLDVVRTVDYAMQRDGAETNDLHVIGKGMAALWCLYAAVFDERIRHLTCDRGLLSYRSLTEGDRYLYSADVFIPDVLLHLDLPEVAAAMAPRPLKFVAPQDAMKGTVDSTRAYEVYQLTREAYQTCGAATDFRIENRGTGEDEAMQLLNALRDVESNERSQRVGWVDSNNGPQSGRIPG